MSKRKRKTVETCYCPLCGSTDILFEARATWNDSKQDWDFFMDSGTDAWCQDCGEMLEGGSVEWGDPAKWVAPENDDE